MPNLGKKTRLLRNLFFVKYAEIRHKHLSITPLQKQQWTNEKKTVSLCAPTHVLPLCVFLIFLVFRPIIAISPKSKPCQFAQSAQNIILVRVFLNFNLATPF